MVLNRRNRVPGGTYFFTVTLADRGARLLVEHFDLLREAVQQVRSAHRFQMLAWIVLPDHLHMVWRLPAGDDAYPMRWRLIKKRFTAALSRRGLASEARGNGERSVWARRFWEHTIRDESDLVRHIDYMHLNPLRHGLVDRVGDWPHSSFHAFVARGLLAAEWGGEGGGYDWDVGE